VPRLVTDDQGRYLLPDLPQANDDPNGGWKGRGLWASVSTRAPFHMETGKGTTSNVIHFQLRPDPLAE
jgi:hypothetical protein